MPKKCLAAVEQLDLNIQHIPECAVENSELYSDIVQNGVGHFLVPADRPVFCCVTADSLREKIHF